MKQALVVAALSTVLGAALAAPAFAAPDNYTIDSKHTFPTFEVNHMGFSIQRGRFDKTRGTLTFDSVAKAGSVDVVIDVDSLDMGFDEWNHHMLDENFFDVKKYPTMTFKSSKFKFKGDTLTEVDGDLTLHGVTKPVKLAIDLFKCGQDPMKKYRCGANATTTIKRTDFGMSAYVPLVGDEIKIAFGVEATKD